MQDFKVLGTISLIFAVVTVLGCGGSDHPADVSTELPVDDASDTLEPPADSDTDIDYDTGTDADTDTDTDEVCTPSCGERVCGPDPVCEQSCGQCPEGKTCNSEGQCVAEGCVPACGERKCGPDPVCGTSCGECEAHEKCNDDGQCECVPACSPRQCGLDPVCGTSCGECEAHEKCNDDGQCECDPACGPRQCGLDPVCGTSCGECEAHEKCNDDGQCIPNDTGIEWVRITGGSFFMGSNDGDSDEKPVHRVAVPTFEMSKTQVTVDQYIACVDAGACTEPDTEDYCNWIKSDRGSHPVNCVDWDQAQAFARWVGGRLPSEAEWEYAARSGGRDWKYPWGDEAATCERAVMYDSSYGCGRGGTWPVCSKPSGNTTHGLCDMAGNVWEWVQDWWHDSYNGAPTDGSAWESPTGSYRVYRGGSWDYNARGVRAAYRNDDAPRARYGNLGFRLARSVP